MGPERAPAWTGGAAGEEVDGVKVLIATDGSDISIDAARRGRDLLDPSAELVLLTVVDELPGAEASGFAGPVYTEDEQERLELEERVEATAEIDRTLEALGHPPVERIVDVGEPAATICVVAERIDADVVVVGSHGRGFVSRVLLGSVSEHVLRHAPCPVLVVRHVEPS